jgi:hypothetical protein
MKWLFPFILPPHKLAMDEAHTNQIADDHLQLLVVLLHLQYHKCWLAQLLHSPPCRGPALEDVRKSQEELGA